MDKFAFDSFALERLINFQQDGIDYLYDLELPQNNLFWAGNFSAHDSKADDLNSNTSTHPFDNAQFRIKSIDFNLPKLNVDKMKQLNINVLKEVEYTKQLSITWLEDVYQSVMAYHLDWLSYWYDRHRDCVRCGAKGKFRGLDVVLFRYKEANSKAFSPLDSVAIPEPVLCISPRGMIPLDMGKLTLSMDGSGEPTRTIQYAINKCTIKYYKPLISSNKNIFGDKDSIKGLSIPEGLWQPTPSDDKDYTNEGWRLTRATSSEKSGHNEIG